MSSAWSKSRPLELGIALHPCRGGQVHSECRLARLDLGRLGEIIGGVRRLFVRERAHSPGVERDGIERIDRQRLIEQLKLVGELTSLARIGGADQLCLDFSCRIGHAAE